MENSRGASSSHHSGKLTPELAPLSTLVHLNFWASQISIHTGSLHIQLAVPWPDYHLSLARTRPLSAEVTAVRANPFLRPVALPPVPNPRALHPTYSARPAYVRIAALNTNLEFTPAATSRHNQPITASQPTCVPTLHPAARLTPDYRSPWSDPAQGHSYQLLRRPAVRQSSYHLHLRLRPEVHRLTPSKATCTILLSIVLQIVQRQRTSPDFGMNFGFKNSTSHWPVGQGTSAPSSHT